MARCGSTGALRVSLAKSLFQRDPPDRHPWAPSRGHLIWRGKRAGRHLTILGGRAKWLPSFLSRRRTMERSEWERDRKMAVRHVIQGRSIVARRRECVERLARKGLDTTEAQRTLHMFTRTLNIFEDDLTRILAREPGKRKRQPPPRLVMRLIRRASGENRTTTGLPRTPKG